MFRDYDPLQMTHMTLFSRAVIITKLVHSLQQNVHFLSFSIQCTCSHLYTNTHTHTHIYIYIYMCVCVCVCVCGREGAIGLKVTIEENEIGKLGSNSGLGCLRFNMRECHWGQLDSISWPRNYEKIIGIIELSNLRRPNSLGKENNLNSYVIPDP